MYSIIIPTFNGEKRVGKTIEALLSQNTDKAFEIIVVNDGSSDRTLELLEEYNKKDQRVIILDQKNAGPAAARNNGAKHAQGDIILFTDDDCIPEPDWFEHMIRPFDDKEIAGAKGTYLCAQKEDVAKFVQIEYEFKYEKLKRHNTIDTIDTYSAAFRKDIFLELGGYDETFPVACAEDFEFSYRMSGKGHKMVFVPEAKVWHHHPDTLKWYLQKKYKFAYWRWLAIKKNPGKLKNDTHTPNTMKYNALNAPILLLSFFFSLFSDKWTKYFLMSLGVFAFLSKDFYFFILRKKTELKTKAPIYIFGRAVAQFLGILRGFLDIFIFNKYKC